VDLLTAALAGLRNTVPNVQIQARHLATAAQIGELRADRLDVALVRERVAGREFDAMLVVTEGLGVLLSTVLADEIAESGGVRLEALAGLTSVGFPRQESPAWYDQIIAVLRSHGVEVDSEPPNDQPLIPQVKFAGVQAGRAFAFAPAGWSQPLPDDVTWRPLVGTPLVRRTWAVWRAGTRRREVGAFVAALEPQDR
jgi:hypothetical protein